MPGSRYSASGQTSSAMRPLPSFPASPSILGSGRSAIRFHSERYVRIVRVLQLNERGCALTHRVGGACDGLTALL
jgi:hypothetical protein